jgi:hypothetical protein
VLASNSRGSDVCVGETPYRRYRNKSTASSVREAVRVVILLCDPIRNGSYYYALISN